MNDYQTEPLNLTRTAPVEHVNSAGNLCKDCNSEYCVVKKFMQYESNRERTGRCHRFECESCGKSYSALSSLRNHRQKAHVEITTFRCGFCTEVFTAEYALKMHLKQHPKEKPFECSVCFKRFARKSSLSAHNRLHKSTESDFQCTICGKRFTWKSNLSAHLQLHLSKKFPCEVCLRVFKSMERLTQHQQKHADPENQCRYCDKIFTNRYKVNYHIRLQHANIAPWQCQLCSESFSTASKYRSHIYEIHDSQKPFSCEKCAQTFQTKHNLDVHQAAHTKNDHFECDVCGQRFAFKRNLYSHMRRHIPNKESNDNRLEKPRIKQNISERCEYFCKECNRSFSNKKTAMNCTHNATHFSNGMNNNMSNANISNETKSDANEMKVTISLVSENRADQIIPLYELNIPAVDSTSTPIDIQNSKPPVDRANEEIEPVILVQAFTTPLDSIDSNSFISGNDDGPNHMKDPFEAFYDSFVPEIIVIDDNDSDDFSIGSSTDKGLNKVLPKKPTPNIPEKPNRLSFYWYAYWLFWHLPDSIVFKHEFKRIKTLKMTIFGLNNTILWENNQVFHE